MKLRKTSGQGMMDCKKALAEAGGDIDQAMEILRKKGMATLAKRAGRDTTEGRVVSKTSDDGRVAVMATLCCETDFVSKSDDFIATTKTLADYAMACQQDEGPENILETTVDGKKFSECLTDLVSKIGEKTEVGDYVKYSLDSPGFVSVYLHFNNKVATMIHLETSDDTVASSDTLKQVIGEVAMHVTAMKPLALDKDGINAETIEREKAIFAEQVKNKPENIIEKIIEGKIKKFFAENCLLDQKFVKDDSKTVAQVVADAGKQAGGEAKIKRFIRLGVG